MNFQQSYLYWLAGAVLLIVALMSWQDKANPRRFTTGLFWGNIWRTVSAWRLDILAVWRQTRGAYCRLALRWLCWPLIAGFGGVKLGSYHQRTQQQREESASRLG
ncbi:Protein of uncharacterised function (DUF979) [Citrobacter freundii]|nr:Protein of uncharacterised function (DUF979) [Citrobacter freundii]